MHSISDSVRDRIGPGVPQPTERQPIGNQIDAAMIFARADFVNVQLRCRWLHRLVRPIVTCPALVLRGDDWLLLPQRPIRHGAASEVF